MSGKTVDWPPGKEFDTPSAPSSEAQGNFQAEIGTPPILADWLQQLQEACIKREKQMLASAPPHWCSPAFPLHVFLLSRSLAQISMCVGVTGPWKEGPSALSCTVQYIACGVGLHGTLPAAPENQWNATKCSAFQAAGCIPAVDAGPRRAWLRPVIIRFSHEIIKEYDFLECQGRCVPSQTATNFPTWFSALVAGVLWAATRLSVRCLGCAAPHPPPSHPTVCGAGSLDTTV